MLRALTILFICLTSVSCDQLTKFVAQKALKGLPPVSFWGDLFRLQYAENSGAFLSFGSRLPESLRFWLLTVTVGIFLAASLVYLLLNSRMDRWSTLGMSLVVGGGMSNLMDRMLRPEGRVVDFMNIGIGSLRTGIFNMADVAIMLGVGLLVAEIVKKPAPR